MDIISRGPRFALLFVATNLLAACTTVFCVVSPLYQSHYEVDTALVERMTQECCKCTPFITGPDPTQATSRTQCLSNESFIWVRGACQTKTSWHGFTEIGQTHVVKAHGETRHAPKVIAEREAELLFFPTEDAQPTVPPTSAPTETVDHIFGLEQVGDFHVGLASSTDIWPAGYPKDKTILIDGSSQYYGIPAEFPNVSFNFDLQAERAVQGVYLQIWYYSRVDSIQVGLRADDGANMDDLQSDATVSDSEWTWIDGGSYTSGVNEEAIFTFATVPVRYVQVRIRGGWRGGNRDSEWGLRMIKISGSMDGSIVGGSDDDEEEADPINAVGYFPGESGDVVVEAYDASGVVLGTINARPTSQQSGILDQSQVENTLTPYSDSRDMWSSTLPWQWVKEGTELIISVPHDDGSLLAHTLTLHNVAVWSEHTLIRQKFVVFGDESQFNGLNTFTFDPHQLSTGMYGIMPVASLNWVDATDLHWPYLVVGTSNGASRVSNEEERRSVLTAAGDDPTNEPQWEVTKNMVAFRNSYANTGRGFSLTTLSASGNHGSPYSTQTSIAMGWSLVNGGSDCSFCEYKKLGNWDWAAAAWLGWCGMQVGDECGNTLSHEIGHSMSLNHFNTGTAENWDISGEYPQDGTHLNSHPWGYDTPSRQFRTWYDVTDGSSKKDPMNGGDTKTIGSCYPHYTGYHGQKSQNWGSRSTQILSSDVSSVPSDGMYLYNPETKSLATASPEPRFMASVETGIPVVTLMGTLGSDDDTCQTYPPSMMSYGHTFQFPDPFSDDLVSEFDGAGYMVVVNFADGSSESGLIASPDLRGSTELRLYSFNVALSRRPTSVDLYRFDAESYPKLSLSSAKTLLDSRTIAVSIDHIENISQVTKVGRGWLGHSGDVRISKCCFSANDCAGKKTEISWRGTEGAALSFSASVTSALVDATASSLTFDAIGVEDGSTHQITVAASRYVEDSGWVPLIGGVPPVSGLPPDASHGVAFWLPYNLNSNLPPGTYSVLAPVAIGRISSAQFVDLRIELDLFVPVITDTVKLGAVSFTSAPFATDTSSVYFLAQDPVVGPSKRTWWGVSRDTLTVPLVAANCNNIEVIASIKAQNKCGSSFFQMSAGRGANDCTEHYLHLELDDAVENPWLNDAQGCKFETRSVTPLTISAYRWHQPNAGALLGSMHLAIVVDLGSLP